MRLCWIGNGGKRSNCVTLPGGGPPYPNQIGHPGIDESELGVYPNLISDAMSLNAIHEIAKGISDEKTRKALHSGIESAVHAIQERIGKDMTISLED